MDTNLYQITYRVSGRFGMFEWETWAETAKDAVRSLRTGRETYAEIIRVYQKTEITKEFWG